MKSAVMKLVTITILSALAAFSPVSNGLADESFSIASEKISDKKTGLEWAVDAGTPSFRSCTGGKKTWHEAADYVRCLNVNNYLGHGDWRLPSARELSRLVSKFAGHKYDMAGPKLKELGFKNIQPSLYWSSGIVTDEIALAVEVMMSGESTHPVGTLNTLFVWPVRGVKKENKN